MKSSKQKFILIISGALLLIGFLFFIPQKSYAVNFTAGWYEDHGGVQDNYCDSGYWRGTGEVKDYSGDPLLADEIKIRAIWYEEGAETGNVIYNETFENLATSTFESECIEIKDNDGAMVLEITAIKSGFHTMKAANNFRPSGSPLNRSTWSKTLHLAPLSVEDANIVYLFPEDNQWISGDEGYDEMILSVNKAPRPENIKEIEVEFTHIPTGHKFYVDVDIPGGEIDEGEVSFPRPDFAGELGEEQSQGQYSWRVRAMTTNGFIFYNENESSSFYYDSIEPFSDSYRVYVLRSGKEQAPYLYATFKDEPVPSSGMCKVEIYFRGHGETDYELVRTCTGSGGVSLYYCSWTGTYKEYTQSETHRGYFIGYDCAGNKKQTPVSSYTIRQLSPSRLYIRSYVDMDRPDGNVGWSDQVWGVPFDVIEVISDSDPPDVPATGTYQTSETFTSYDQYGIALEATTSYNGRPFSFWFRTPRSGTSWACYSNLPEYSLTVRLPYTYRRYMSFGTSRLIINGRWYANQGSMSSELKNYLDNITTRIEQTGGTPENIIDSYVKGGELTIKNKSEEMNDVILKFHNSEDSILEFYSIYSFRPPFGSFCSMISDQQCQASLPYNCGFIYPRYSIRRTVRVEGWMGSIPLEGVSIVGSGGMESGVTSAAGYYDFSSYDSPSSFTGSLQAPEIIIDSEGNEMEFGYWSGCSSVSADGLTCNIEYSSSNPGVWYDDISITIQANYTSEGGPPAVNCGTEVGDGQCVPNSPPWYCEEGVLRPFCLNCGCPSYQTCIDDGDYGFCWPHYNLSVSSDPIDNINISGIDPDDPGEDYGGFTDYELEIVSPPYGPSVIELTAPESHTGNDGLFYTFKEWEGCNTTTDFICEIVMDEHKNVVAHYISGPNAPTDLSLGWFDCSVKGLSVPVFGWDYEHSGGISHSSSEIIIYGEEELLYTCSGCTSYIPPYSWIEQNLPFGQNLYSWKARVQDEVGNWSEWSEERSFRTRNHAHPWVSFNWEPIRPVVNQVTQFCSVEEGGVCEIEPNLSWSECFSNNCNWTWAFPDGYSCVEPGACFLLQNPLIKFSEPKDDDGVKLRICDPSLSESDGEGEDYKCCHFSEEINVALPLPEWKEVPPL
jgi:hypothetical protein